MLPVPLAVYWQDVDTHVFNFVQAANKAHDRLSETEELDFQFDDDLDLGGKKHNFSDQPWYVTMQYIVCLVFDDYVILCMQNLRSCLVL